MLIHIEGNGHLNAALRSKPLTQWRRRDVSLVLFNGNQTASNIRVELALVIPVIGQGGVNLSEREMWKLEMQFLRAPAIRGLCYDQFDDFHRRAHDHGNVTLIENDVLIARFGACHCASPTSSPDSQ